MVVPGVPLQAPWLAPSGATPEEARGAVVGGAVGAGRRSARKQQEQQAQAQAQAQYQQGADGYNRAVSACLGGRGYVVQ